MTDRRWIVPIGVLVLAFCLRLFALNSRPLWYDEAFSVLLAEQDLQRIVAGTAADTMPPLYIVLLHFWLPLVGETPLAMRMLSVFFSTLVVALVYMVGTRGVTQSVGEWAGLFAAIAPFQIYFGQELRMYSLLAFAGVLCIYAVMRLESRGLHSVLLITLSTALALYTHNLAPFTLLAANVYLLFRRAWKLQTRLLVGQGLGVMLAIPWLLYVPNQMAGIQRAYWTKPPGAVDILQMLLMFTTFIPLPSLLIAAALFVTLAVLALGIVELRHVVKGRAAAPAGLFSAFFVVPPALVFAVSYIVYPVFIPRGVIVSSIAYYLLLAIVAARVARAGRLAILAVVFLVCVATLPFLYTHWGEWRRAPFAQADQYLSAQIGLNDLILHDNKLTYFPMNVYNRTLPQEYLADPPGTANDTLSRTSQEAMRLSPIEFSGAVRAQSRVWFVILQTALDQAAEEGRPHGNLSRLDDSFKRVQVTPIGDLRIFLYEPR